MACGGCGGGISGTTAKVEPHRVLVEVRNHTDTPSMLIGPSGTGYSLRSNGDRLYVLREDADAEPSRFAVVVDSAVAGDGKSRQVADSRTRALLRLREAEALGGGPT